MKTAEEKATAFVKNNIHLIRNGAEDRLATMLTIYLKEQDRDTRHACTEELLKLKRYGGADESLVILHEAESACMNVKAV